MTSSKITIEASAEEVRKVLYDIAAYPTWSKTIKAAQVESSDDQGRPLRIQLTIEAGMLRDKPTLDYDWSGAPDQVTFSLVDADLLMQMDGTYTVKSLGDETEVTYELNTDVTMPVPKPMLQQAELSTIKLALDELKAYVEA
ncbi:MAG: SRPBCC family protein [Candidatus Nanopelagicaceae bacterium]